jgi:hypothetical protein
MNTSTDSKQSEEADKNSEVILGYSQISDHKRGFVERDFEKFNREFTLSSQYCACPRPSTCSTAKSVC